MLPFTKPPASVVHSHVPDSSTFCAMATCSANCRAEGARE